MADWVTISALATAGGTLVLAVATFASVRSANRAARTAERALQAGLRAVLLPSRLEDPAQKVLFRDDHWVTVPGGRAVIEPTGEVLYLAMGLRNVGTGLAVIHGYRLTAGAHQSLGGGALPADPADFNSQQRDLYVPAGDTGFWQAALRDPADPAQRQLAEAAGRGQGLTVDLLYGDHEGGQRTITRFVVTPGDQSGWLTSAARHWNLDRGDPRTESASGFGDERAPEKK